MAEYSEEVKIPSIAAIKSLLEPILIRLEKIENSVNSKTPATEIKFYRNEDLKRLFGLSSNTIIKYRETGIIPYTKLGDIYLYDVNEIKEILAVNAVSL